VTSKRQQRRALGKAKATARKLRPKLIPVSTFPAQYFENHAGKPSAPHQFLAFRLILDFLEPSAEVVGTATVIAPGILATAKHLIIDHIVGEGPHRYSSRRIWALQVLPGPRFFFWRVRKADIHSIADLALLFLDDFPEKVSDDGELPPWMPTRMSPVPPGPGGRVAAFGYRLSRLSSRNGLNFKLDDESMSSSGIVRRIFPLKRDDVFMPFPCFQVSARFDGGMSGGPVIDESGGLCGIVSSGVSMQDDDPAEPISYASILWPIFMLGSAGAELLEIPGLVKHRQEVDAVFDLIKAGKAGAFSKIAGF
jgi:hypothetical protein